MQHLQTAIIVGLAVASIACNGSGSDVLEDEVEALDINQAVANELERLAMRARNLDPTLCADKGLQESVVEGIVTKLAENELPAPAEQFYKYVGSGKKFIFKNASVVSRKPDIFEQTCSANLMLNGKSELITYAIRPALDPAEGVVLQGVMSDEEAYAVVDGLTVFLANETGASNTPASFAESIEASEQANDPALPNDE